MKYIVTFIFLFSITVVFSQKGIGTNNPDASSVLDVTSTTKGLLKPRMTSTQRTNINSPATGLEVFDTTTNTTWYYNGTVWVNAGEIADLRVVGTRNHITSDAGIGSNGTSAGIGSDNILMGLNAGSSFSSAAAIRNIMIGAQSGVATTTGGRNIFIGFGAGFSNIDGGFNFFIGNNSGGSNTSGSNNVFFGTNSGNNNTTGGSNLFIGPLSGDTNTTGSANIVLGNNISAASATSSNQLNLGAILFGTGVNEVTGTTISSGRLGIANSSPDASAVLDIASTDKGLLKPRMTSTQRTNINSPATGLEVFDTTTNTTWYHNGTAWVNADEIADLRIVGTDNHITSDAGAGSNGTSVGTGTNNILIGKNSGAGLTSESNNVFVGTQAGQNATVANSTFLGYQAGNITTGASNTFIGYQSGKVVASGSNNTFVGNNSGLKVVAGSSNSIFGTSAGLELIGGSQNSLFGNSAGASVTNGGSNTMFGNSSGFFNNGSSNVFIGHLSGASQVSTGSFNVFLGTESGRHSTSSNNVFVGYRAGFRNSGLRNTIVGHLAGGSNTASTSTDNTFIGNSAGLANTTGGNNTFLGHGAGDSNTTGQQNTFVGDVSGAGNISGTGNTFLGYNSGANNTGGNNIIIGNTAGTGLFTGNQNIIIGNNITTANTLSNELNIGGIILGTGVNDVTGAVISTGRLGIGVAPHATDKLYVGGNLRTAGFITAEVVGSSIPDYVFEKFYDGKSDLKDTYIFKTLEEVEAFIKLNKHLPGVMGMHDLERTEEGKYMVNLSKLSNQTLEKVEELFLYTISQEKKIKNLEAENKDLKERLAKIEKALGL